MSNNYLSSKMNQINLVNKEGENTHPVNINLTLLSNKSSVETLMSLAAKNIAGTSNSKLNISNNATPIKHSTKIHQQDDDKEEIADTVYEEKEEKMKIQNFIRGTRKGLATISTKIHGRLEIMKKLNNNQNFSTQPHIKQQILLFIEDQLMQSKEIIYEESPTKFEPTRKTEKKKSLFGQSNSQLHKEMIYDKAKYSIEKGLSVLEFSYQEDQNIAQKKYMEDKGKAIDCFNNNPNEGLFCIFDGHGGSSVAFYLQENYPSIFKNALQQCNGNIEQALKTSFKKIDLEIKSLELVHVGSTGCVVYIKKNENNQIVYTANVGDTRCSLICPLSIDILSYDHRAIDTKEKQRIINAGGSVINERVMGQLMVSRAFGDFELKSFGVKVAPSISKRVINPTVKNQIIIMASDGVWDIIDENEMQNEIMFNTNTELLCKKIIKNSISKGSWDNLSCFAIKLT